MSDIASRLADAVERLGRCDATLFYLSLTGKRHTDAELADLVDCLLAHPDIVGIVDLKGNRLTDETGVKLARYMAASSTIRTLNLTDNQLGEATYLAVAAALRVNTSIRYLFLYDNQAVDASRVESAFVEALRLNPDRPPISTWRLITTKKSKFDELNHLQAAAEQLGHPSLQMLLALLQ